MKIKEFEKLKKGDKVLHKHYGESEVVDYIPEFGPVIQPCSEEGKKLLQMHSGADYDTPLLEDSNRSLTAKSL
jgi:hypothetical protein